MAKITLALLGNRNFDTRSGNLMKMLQMNGHEVLFVGFDWLTPGFNSLFSSDLRIHRLHKGVFSWFFYLKFALLLVRDLYRAKSKLYWAADLFCLPFCFLAARMNSGRVFYDSREIYTEIHGIGDRKILKPWIRKTEGFLIRRVDAVFVTGAWDAQFLMKLYSIPIPRILRNLPLSPGPSTPVNYRQIHGFMIPGKILLYQGLLVRGRGIETCLRILQKLTGYSLVLLGSGEHEKDFRQMAVELNVQDRVCFHGKIAQNELPRYTAGADIGLALIENINLNNKMALPNKLFEYIMAGIPVIATDLPQMAAVIEQYRVGAVVPEGDVERIVRILKNWERHPQLFQNMKNQCRIASGELNWETEFSHIGILFEECPE